MDWLEKQQTSGLTVATFCDSVGGSRNTFCVQRRKLAEQQTPQETFIPLELSSTSIALIDVELRHLMLKRHQQMEVAHIQAKDAQREAALRKRKSVKLSATVASRKK